MQRWVRATHDRVCGYCVPARPILRGEPMLEITLVQVKGSLVRCVHCHGPAPSSLPPLPEESPRAAGDFTHVAAAAPRREWMPYRED